MADQLTPGSDAPQTPATGSPAPTTQADTVVLQQRLDNTISQVNGLKSQNDALQKQVADSAATAEAARTLRVEATVKGLLLDATSELPPTTLRTIREKMEAMSFDSADQAAQMFDALKSTALSFNAPTQQQGQTPSVATPPPTPPKTDDGGASGSPAPTVDTSKMTAKEKLQLGYEKSAKGTGQFT